MQSLEHVLRNKMKYQTIFRDQLKREFDRRIKSISDWEEEIISYSQQVWEFYKDQVQIYIQLGTGMIPPDDTRYNGYLQTSWWLFWQEIISRSYSIEFIGCLQDFLENILNKDTYFKIVKVKWSFERGSYVIVDTEDPDWEGAVQVLRARGVEKKASQDLNELLSGWEQQLRFIQQQCVDLIEQEKV